METNIKFCEPSYARSSSIAEFWNALSSAAYILPFIFLNKELMEWHSILGSWLSASSFIRFTIAGLSYVSLGICSAAFHATQTWWAEGLDELSMVLACTTMLYAMFGLHTLTSGRKGYLSMIVFTLVQIASAAIYLLCQLHVFFAMSYICSTAFLFVLIFTIPQGEFEKLGMVNLKVLVGTDIEYNAQFMQSWLFNMPVHKSNAMGFMCISAGYAIWHVDQICSREGWTAPISYPYEFHPHYWSHPIWHVLTAIGVVFIFHSIVRSNALLHISKQEKLKNMTELVSVSNTDHPVEGVSLGLPLRKAHTA